MAGGKGKKGRGGGSAAAKKRKGLKTWEMVVLGALALAVAWGGWAWWSDEAVESEFLKLAAVGAPGLSEIETQPGGGGHFTPGQSSGYREQFPTSGMHDPKWANPGAYVVADAVMLTDEAGQIIQVNPAFAFKYDLDDNRHFTAEFGRV